MIGESRNDPRNASLLRTPWPDEAPVDPLPDPTVEDRIEAWIKMHLSIELHSETQYYDSDRATHRVSLMIDGKEFSHIAFDT